MRPPVLLEVGALLRQVVPIAAITTKLRRLITITPPSRRRRRRPPIQLRRHPSQLFIVVYYRRGLRQLHSGRRLQGGLRPAPQSRRRAVAVALPYARVEGRQGGLLRLRRFPWTGPPLAPRLLGAVRVRRLRTGRRRLGRMVGGAGPPHAPPLNRLLRREGLFRRRRGAAAPIRAGALVAVAGRCPQAQQVGRALGRAPHLSVCPSHRRRPAVAPRAAPTVRAPRSGPARNAVTCSTGWSFC